MKYIIVPLICFSPLLIALFYCQLKARSYSIYIHEYDGPDQISKYYKVNLYTNKRKIIYRDEYWLNVLKNFDNQSKFEKLMDESPFGLLR